MTAILIRERNKRRLRCPVMRIVWLLAWPLAASLLTPALAVATTPPYLPVPVGAAVILNTGSTNLPGYRIVVQRDGSAEFVSAAGRDSGRIPAELAARFFRDLRTAAPLHILQHMPCMKSVSFGSSIFVYWDHSRSPDLSCPSTSAGQALYRDVIAVTNALHVKSAFAAPVIRPLMPGEHHRPLPPSVSPSPNA